MQHSAIPIFMKIRNICMYIAIIDKYKSVFEIEHE
jgi:hypothetical protein